MFVGMARRILNNGPPESLTHKHSTRLEMLAKERNTPA
jgi:hypothetical protein